MGIGFKIGIDIGTKLGKPIEFGLKNNSNLDFIDTGIVISDTIDVDIWAKFVSPSASQIMGSLLVDSYCLIGVKDNAWRFGFGNNSGFGSPSGVSDGDLHKFSIRTKKLYVDDIEIIDRTDRSITGGAVIFYLYGLFGSTTAYAEAIITKVVNNSNGRIFTPHIDGYWKDDLGNDYFNRGEASNLYPLEVVYL